MTIYNFNQFALSRDEIKKIVGGFADSASKRCTGACTTRREDGIIVDASCVVRKVKKNKVCVCSETHFSSTCGYTD